MSRSKRQTKQSDPKMVVRAHQFLYYQGRAVWSDYKYDQYCRSHNIDGSGGSDSPADYTAEEKELAAQFEKNPHLLG